MNTFKSSIYGAVEPKIAKYHLKYLLRVKVKGDSEAARVIGVRAHILTLSSSLLPSSATSTSTSTLSSDSPSPSRYWVDAKVSADFFKNFLNDVALLWIHGFHAYGTASISS